MKKTVGVSDRAVRGVIAVAALIFAGVIGFSSAWGIVLVIVAVVMAATGSSGYCPLYSATGVSTLAKGGHHDDQLAKSHLR